MWNLYNSFVPSIMAITRSTSRERRAKREGGKHTAGESLLVERRLIVNGEERGREGRLSARHSARTRPLSLCKWTCGLWGVLLLGESRAFALCA